jgi:hypothetical protein
MAKGDMKGREEGIEGRPIWGWRKSENKQLDIQIIYKELSSSVKIREIGQKVELNQLRTCTPYRNRTMSVKMDSADINPD